MTPTKTQTIEAATFAVARRARRARLAYWISTGLVCAVMLFSVYSFTFHDRFPFPDGKEGAFVHLGLPPWFKVELTVAKALGLLALLVPGVPRKVRELAYVGFGVTLLSAGVAHLSVGDARLSPLYVLDPLLFLGCLGVSYVLFLRGARERDGGAPAPRLAPAPRSPATTDRPRRAPGGGDPTAAA